MSAIRKNQGSDNSLTSVAEHVEHWDGKPLHFHKVSQNDIYYIEYDGIPKIIGHETAYEAYVNRVNLSVARNGKTIIVECVSETEFLACALISERCKDFRDWVAIVVTDLHRKGVVHAPKYANNKNMQILRILTEHEAKIQDHDEVLESLPKAIESAVCKALEIEFSKRDNRDKLFFETFDEKINAVKALINKRSASKSFDALQPFFVAAGVELMPYEDSALGTLAVQMCNAYKFEFKRESVRLENGIEITIVLYDVLFLERLVAWFRKYIKKPTKPRPFRRSHLRTLPPLAGSIPI